LIVRRNPFDSTIAQMNLYQAIRACEADQRGHGYNMLVPSQLMRITLLGPFAALSMEHLDY
jgi:hypothetical protein